MADADDACWLTRLEESCSALNAVVECQPDDIPLSKHQTDAADRIAVRWLETIGEDDPFGEGIRSDSIPLEIQNLVQAGFGKQLEWIQSALLSACSARLASLTCDEGAGQRKSIYDAALRLNLACPILARESHESSALRSEPFRFAMAQLNLYPSTPHSLLYPRIPPEWSADTLYTLARLLGPVRQSQVHFNLSSVKPVPLYRLSIGH